MKKKTFFIIFFIINIVGAIARAIRTGQLEFLFPFFGAIASLFCILDKEENNA